MHHTAAVSSSPAYILPTRTAGTETHPASAAETNTLGKPLQFGSGHRIRSNFEGNLPSLHTRYCGMVSQADTHLGKIRGSTENSYVLQRASLACGLSLSIVFYLSSGHRRRQFVAQALPGRRNLECSLFL